MTERRHIHLHGVIPARVVRQIANRARRFRAITQETHASSPKIAKALRISTKTVQDWHEVQEAIPASYFAVIEAAYDRELEAMLDSGDPRRFLDFLPIFARTARLPGFGY